MTDTTAAPTGPGAADRSQPTAADERMIKILSAMRRLHYNVVDQGSEDQYRRRRLPTSPPPRLIPACHKYKHMGWLPPEIMVAEKLPREASLPLRYFVSYYGTSLLAWGHLERNPLSPDVPWRPEYEWNKDFPIQDDGWGRLGPPTSDRNFVQLRLQGPNPFMLRRLDDDIDDKPAFVVDFGELFDGVFDPVVATFVVENDRLTNHSIRVGDRTVRPGEPGWDDAKRIVNGLDTRYAVFVRHLFNCHFTMGDAYAVAAYSLADWHPLRSFLDYFTYGTLTVNHIAYKTLLASKSYFLLSNYISAEDAKRLLENSLKLFDFCEWVVPHDIDNRGLEAIPEHPYVKDAKLAWPALRGVVSHHLAKIGIDDDAIANDRELRIFYERLRQVMPDDNHTIPPLNDTDDLVTLLTALLYNNVIHEVCGNFAPLFASDDPADKVGVDLEHLRALARGEQPPPPTMASVYLMDQAAFTTRFNVGGNKMLTLTPARFVDDPKLLETIVDLQAALGDVEDELDKHNSDRDVDFSTMRPSRWEASISF